MASIDQRIVELKFNAKNFQSGIQAAIASLDNLKKNLNMNKAADEFDKVEKASKKVTLKDLYNSVDSVSQRFSTLGIIGMSALNQLTTSAMQAGKKLLSALTSPLIEGGKRRALNIEQAKFQIEGLGYTWAQVEADINYGVKDTAYGLDAAAKAASQLLASQVKVGEEMKASLRGISGVAAMTSSEYEDIAQIFTTVAGNGRLMGDQLMQLSSRGLNAAATLGQYLGKSEGEIREMVSKGKIDFKTFANAMDSAFGEHAKKANETFTGSLSNMKAALARIGAEVAAPAYQNLRDIFNSLTPVIDGVKAALIEKGGLIDSIKDGMTYVTNFATATLKSLGGKEGVAALLAPTMEKLSRILKAFGSLLLGIAKTIGGIVTPILSAFGEVLGGSLLDAIAGAIEILAEFVNSIAFTARMSNNLKKTFVAIFTVVDVLFKIISGIVSVVTRTLFTAFSATFGFVLDVILAITGHIGDLIVRIHQFVMDLLKLDTVQAVLNGIVNIFKRLKDGVTKVYTAIRTLVGVIIDAAFDSAYWIFDKIATVILLIATFIDKTITKLRELIARFKQLPAVQKFIETIRTSFAYLHDNIGEVANDLKNRFVAAVRAAKDVIGGFVERLRELIEQYVELPTLQEVVTAVVEFMTTTFEKAVELFNNVKEVLGNIFDRVAELNKMSLKAIIENFGKLKNKIVEIVDVSGRLKWLQETFIAIRNGAIVAADGTATTLGLIKEKLIQFVEWAKGKFAQLTMSDIMAAGIGGTFIVFLVQMTKFIATAEKLTKNVDGIVGAFKKIAKSISGAFESIAEIGKAKAQSIKIEAISSLIKSVVLLAGAVALLANMDPQRVVISSAAIFVLAGGLIGLSTAMNVINSKTDPKAIAATSAQMTSAATSILVLSAALKLLSTIPVGQIISSLVAITILMGEMLGFMVVMEKVAPTAVKESASMLLVASSLLLLGRAMAMIGTLSAGDILKSLGVMTTLMVGLGVMFKISRRVAITKKGVLGIIAIVGALFLMVQAIKSIAKLDTQVMITGLTRLMAVMGTLSLLLVATQLAGQHATKAGIAIGIISVAMNIMVLAIKQMASIDDNMLKQATKSITAILAVFALITAMTKFSGENAIKAGASIMLMAGAIAVIAGAMILIAHIDDKDVQKATAVVIGILGMFALVVAATGMSKACQKTLKQMTICLGMLVAAVAVLALIDPVNLLSASAAISLILATFSMLAASTGKIGPKAMAAVWQLVGVVAVLSILLAALAELKTENALRNATALSELLLVMGGLIVAMSALKVNKIPVTAVAELAAAIDVFILIVGALVVLAGALSQAFPDLSSLLDSGIPILQKIGQALGEFVGGIIGGIAAGASYGLITLAENMTAFINALKPFMDEVSKIDDNVVNGALKLVEMMLLFAAAELINALSFWYEGKSAIESMSEGLPLLGQAMSDFSSSLEGVNLENLAVGSEAAKILAEVGLLMSEGGLKGLIFGSSADGLAGLAENLPNLGRALTTYGDSVADLKVDAVRNSVEPLKSLIEINNMIDKEGPSVFSFFMGESSKGLANLADNLPNLGTALTAYGEAVANLNASAVNNSVDPLRSLVEINNMIENEGGDFLSWFIGGKSDAIRELTENLPGLGTALTTYGEAVSDLKAGAVNASVDPLRSLVEINNMIENEGGKFLSWFIGGKSDAIRELTENLPGLGTALTSYSNSLDGLDAGRVTSSVDPLRSLVEINNMIDNEGGAAGWIFGSSSDGVKNLSENLPKLGEALLNYSNYVKDVSTGKVYSSVNCLQTIIDTLNSTKDGISTIFGGGTSGTLGVLKDNLPKLGEALLNYSNYVKDVSAGDVDKSVDALKKIVEAVKTSEGNSETFRTLGFDIKTFSEGFRDAINNISELNYDSIDRAIESLDKIREVMNRFGEGFPDLSMVLSGFITTLKTAAESSVNEFVGSFKTGELAAGNAARAMIEAALLAMTTKLDVAQGQFKNRGVQLITNFASGIKTGASQVSSGLDSVLKQLSSRLTRANSEFKTKGKQLINNFATGIKGAISLVTAAMDALLTRLVSRITMKASTFRTQGRQIVSYISNGIQSGSTLATSAMSSVVNQITTTLNRAASTFRTRGQQLMSNLASGIRSGASDVNSAISSSVSGASNKVRLQYNNMKAAGSWLMSGLTNGIYENSSGPTNAAYNVGRRVVKALKQATDEASPSKEAKKIGRFLDEGLMIGIVNYAAMAINAAKDLGEDVVDELSPIADQLSFLDDLDPIITPTMDTSYIDKGIARLNSEFSDMAAVPIAVQQGRRASAAFRAMTDKQFADAEIQNGSSGQIINNYDLTQNNYSPKALSRIDIYRDTRNQFSRLKEVVNA